MHYIFIMSLLYAFACFEHCCAHHQEVKIILNLVSSQTVGGRPVHGFRRTVHRIAT